MVNIICCQGSENQNHDEMLLHTHWDGYNQENRMTSVGEDVERLESSCIAVM